MSRHLLLLLGQVIPHLLLFLGHVIIVLLLFLGQVGHLLLLLGQNIRSAAVAQSGYHISVSALSALLGSA